MNQKVDFVLSMSDEKAIAIQLIKRQYSVLRST